MRRILAIGATCMLLASGCGFGGSEERTVLVDYSHDEFASAMFANFPGELTVRQGMRVVFKQVWTGEPHTVTGGRLVDEMMSTAGPWIAFFDAFERLLASGADLPNPDDPDDIPASDLFDAAEEADDRAAADGFVEAYEGLLEAGIDLPAIEDAGATRWPDLVDAIDRQSEAIFDGSGIPWAIDETEDGDVYIAQNAGQPCFLREGAPPKDPSEPCTEQDQPVFDGSASYYNSGIIPYEGAGGNTFAVDLSDDIDPGEYWFYCAVHGPGQSTKLKVIASGAEVPSQEAVNRQARKEIAEFAEPMLETYREAREGKFKIDGRQIEPPYGGVVAPVHGIINEFTPKRITTKVGEEVTWRMMGADHSVSFEVPEYFPIMEFAEDGNVRLNPKLEPPAGGSPAIPDEPDDDGVLRIDGGTYDGEGFFSSGLMSSQPYAEYTLRFSEPGTYRYACLLHPPMVGTVEVS